MGSIANGWITKTEVRSGVRCPGYIDGGDLRRANVVANDPTLHIPGAGDDLDNVIVVEAIQGARARVQGMLVADPACAVPSRITWAD